jgi:branched-chain amino acid transport system permease protein
VGGCGLPAARASGRWRWAAARWRWVSARWRWPVVALAGLVVPPLVASGFVLGQLETVAVMTMVVVGLNVVTGYAGQLALGPSAVFGVGAYAAALVALHLPALGDLGAMCAAGVLAAAALGVLAGVPALRVSGFYLGMTTLLLAAALPVVASHLSLTGRSGGIELIADPRFHQQPGGTVLYGVTWAVLLALVGATALLARSRLGRRFVALRSSEQLAASCGVSGYRTKLVAFLLAAVPAGLAGAFYVFTEQFVSPGSASATLSIYLLAAAVIGGLGTVAGPLVGGAVVFGFTEFFGGLQQEQGIVYALLLIAVIGVLPEGVVGARGRVLRRIVGKALAATQAPRMARAAPTPPAGQVAGPPSAAEAPPAAEARARPCASERRFGEALGTGLLAPRTTPAALVLEGVVKAFGGVEALSGVDLVVEPGTVHALIGPNGSGKTTALNVASGFHRPDRGSVRLGERRISGAGPAAIAQLGVARTFQTPKLLDEGSMLDNVLLGTEVALGKGLAASALRLPAGLAAEREARARALACLGAVGLAQHAFEAAAEAPHGVQRLVELARALASAPGTLLLDEPAAGLSAAELALLEAVVREAAASGVAVLLVEHNLPFVLRVARRITVLHQGRVVAHGGPDEIREDPLVRAIYAGSAGATARPAPGSPWRPGPGETARPAAGQAQAP